MFLSFFSFNRCTILHHEKSKISATELPLPSHSSIDVYFLIPGRRTPSTLFFAGIKLSKQNKAQGECKPYSCTEKIVMQSSIRCLTTHYLIYGYRNEGTYILAFRNLRCHTPDKRKLLYMWHSQNAVLVS